MSSTQAEMQHEWQGVIKKKLYNVYYPLGKASLFTEHMSCTWQFKTLYIAEKYIQTKQTFKKEWKQEKIYNQDLKGHQI